MKYYELHDFEYLKYQYGKPYLHDVFATVLDTFPSITDAHIDGQIYLWELLQGIKYNMNVNVTLTPKYLNDARNNRYDNIKSKLPAICYNANYDGYKDLKHLISPTNLMFLDIDDFNSIEEALAYKNLITLRYDWILACNLSMSRLGLHIIIFVDKIIDNTDYNRKYDFINTEYFEGNLDKNGKSLTRYSIIPFDYNIYINESPNVLNIEHIMKNNEKSISSGYFTNTVIPTAYTISEPSPLNSIMNDAARLDGLRFEQQPNESFFIDPDIPIYDHQGIDVVKINLFPFRNNKVKEGSRTWTIGAITMQMIYLNAQSPEYTEPEIKESILKSVYSINLEICNPPLSYKEVLNSFNANWKKYEAGELDIRMFQVKKHAFWSKKCTLKGNEKRKITCRIKNEPIVAESRRKITEAIEALRVLEAKVTQKKVAQIAGLNIQTVKKYWKELKQ
jgi:VirE N-terminal domain